jgi:hypothetical protein
MKQSYDLVDPRQSHEAANTLFKRFIKPHTAQGGRGRLTWETIDPSTRAGMRRMFHGFILPDLAEQTGYSQEAWKAWLTEKFVPPQLDADGREVEKHTEAMSDEQYATFLLEVQAFAVVDADITFTEKAE